MDHHSHSYKQSGPFLVVGGYSDLKGSPTVFTQTRVQNGLEVPNVLHTVDWIGDPINTYRVPHLAGKFADYSEARKAWQSFAMQSVDNAHMQFCILNEAEAQAAGLGELFAKTETQQSAARSVA